MTITEFLLARIAEDEAAVRGATSTGFPAEWTAKPDETGQPIKAGTHRIATCAESVMAHIARHDPARVLAECEAKRRIVELHAERDPEGLLYPGALPTCIICGGDDPYEFPCDTVKALALPFADHADYDEAWRI